MCNNSIPVDIHCLPRQNSEMDKRSEISGSIFFCVLQDVCREPIVKMNPQRRNIICVAIPLRWIPLQISRSHVTVENKTIFGAHFIHNNRPTSICLSCKPSWTHDRGIQYALEAQWPCTLNKHTEIVQQR